MTRSVEWEEAESEFFQETYPSDRASMTSDLQTFLPSCHTRRRQYSILGGTFTEKTSGTRTRTRTARARMRAAVQGLEQEDSDNDDVEVLDFTDENLSTEDEVWKEMIKIKEMAIPLTQKKAMRSQYQKCPKIKMKRTVYLRLMLRKRMHALSRFFQRLTYFIAQCWRPSVFLDRKRGLDLTMAFAIVKYCISLNFISALIMGIVILLPFWVWSTPPPLYLSEANTNLTMLDDIKRRVFDSMLFYGYYRDTTTILPWNILPYSLPVAYIGTVVLILLIFFLTFSLKFGDLIKTFVHQRSSDTWFKNIFGLCNFAITDENAKMLSQEALYRHFKSKLDKGPGWAPCLFLARGFSFFLTIAIGCAVLALAHYVTVIDFGFFVLPGLSLALANAVILTICQLFRRVEKYPWNLETNLFVSRVLILRLLGLYTYVFSAIGSKSCWENEIGLQLLIILVLGLVIHILKSFFLLSFYDTHCIECVYELTLNVLGLFFSPLFPAVSLAKWIIYYYTNLLVAFLKPMARKIQSPSYIKSQFIIFSFLSINSALLLLVYIFLFTIPSSSCGPFIQFTVTDIFIKTYHEFPLTVKFVLNMVTRAEFLSFSIFVLLCVLYIFYVRGLSNQRVAKDLKSQLVMQGQDKKYLMTRITQLMNKPTIADKCNTK